MLHSQPVIDLHFMCPQGDKGLIALRNRVARADGTPAVVAMRARARLRRAAQGALRSSPAAIPRSVNLRGSSPPQVKR